MYEFDFSNLGTIISSFFNLVGGILSLDVNAFKAVYDQEGGTAMAMAILILGGISLGLGQSVVLMVNRVRRRRFVIRLLLGGLVQLLVVIFWSGTIWLLFTFFIHHQEPYFNLLLGASISMAPLLFGFFVLLPYLGMSIFTLLRVWVLLIYVVVIDTTTGIGYWGAMALSIVGWLLLEFALRFPPLQFDRIRNWYWRITTGTTHRLKVDEMVQHFVKDLRASAGLDKDDPKGGSQ